MAAVQPVLEFDEATHRYFVDGCEFHSITTVIDALGLVDFSAIPQSDLEFYKARGTALHQAAWFSDDGDLNEETIDPVVRPRLDAWQKFRRDLPFEIVASEERRFDRAYGYAGTPDRLVKFRDGSRGVIELKSGPLQPAVAIQLAAQCNLFEVQGGRLKRYAVHLRSDGAYSLKEFPASTLRRDLSTFLSALSCFRWIKENHL